MEIKNIKISIFYIIRCFKNYLKLIINCNINNCCLPNIFIKNVVLIDPNKINFVNSIPMKFYKSTQLILNFDLSLKAATLIKASIFFCINFFETISEKGITEPYFLSIKSIVPVKSI